MAARLPLRAILRDIVMMLCGSFLGILLAQGFVSHDLKMADVARLCGAVQVSKKVERSRMRGGGGGREREVITGIYPYSGYAGSGSSSAENPRRRGRERGRSFDDSATSLGSGKF